MIAVNTLINNALQRTSLLGDGEAATGTQASAVLNDLQCLIAELNTENDLLENYQTFDSTANMGKIKFAVKPSRWFEVEDEAAIQSRIDAGKCLVYDIFKTKAGKFYVIHPDGADLTYVTDDDWSKMMINFWPQFFVRAIPDRVIGFARKIGNRYVQLFPADKMAIDSGNKMSLATLFTSESEVEEVEFPHIDDDPNYQPYIVEYYVIEVNSYQGSEYRAVILKGIPQLTLRDTLHISSKYEAMIEDGLCAKICQRYKLMDVKEDFAGEFESAKRTIKRINHANRPMTYSFVNPHGYDENYWNLYGGLGF